MWEERMCHFKNGVNSIEVYNTQYIYIRPNYIYIGI